MSDRGVPALLILCLAGCAAPQPPVTATTTTTTAAAPGPECERSYRVGSNIPTYNCAAKPTEEERQRMIDEWERAVTPKGKVGSGG